MLSFFMYLSLLFFYLFIYVTIFYLLHIRHNKHYKNDATLTTYSLSIVWYNINSLQSDYIKLLLFIYFTAVDLSITSPLCHESIQVACVMTGSAALWAEKRKHNTNDEKCRELGWVSILFVVESYGCWGTEAQHFFSTLSGRLASRLNQPKSIPTDQMY